MTIDDADRIITAAMQWIPAHMDTTKARIMMVAIGLQESRFKARRQIGGPAHGYWQFEHGGGCLGVLSHRASSKLAKDILTRMNYKPEPAAAYRALVDNDTLAAVFARLLLWTLPEALPDTPEQGWNQYIKAWRPGKPHPQTWDGFYNAAKRYYDDRKG